MAELGLCRLCAKTKPILDLLHSENEYWIEQDLETKIQKLFQINIFSTDKLPKAVCSKCCDNVILIWDFNEVVQWAQETLQSLISTTIVVDSDLEEHEHDLLNIDIRKEESQQEQIERLQSVQLAVELFPDENGQMATKEIQSNVNNNKRKGILSNGHNAIMKKRRPGCRPKLKTIRKVNRKTFQKIELHDTSDEDDDNLSVLSGASEADKNEDGSLILSGGLKGWDAYPWPCVSCDEILDTVTELRTHQQLVHDNHVPKYLCCDCLEVSTKYYYFMYHVRTHRSHLRFCCDLCYKFFSTRKLLKCHRVTHLDDRSYKCATCDKIFQYKCDLFLHARSHSPEETIYACDACPKQFTVKTKLITHKRIHANILNFTCEQCGKRFHLRNALNKHLINMHHTSQSSFCCEFCGKVFTLLNRLKHHRKIHDELKPHLCNVCGKLFRAKSGLIKHMRIHAGVKPHACHLCGKCFGYKTVLSAHMRQHTGERPYSCETCQHHFTNWPNYKKHMKCRHGINTSKSDFRKSNETRTK